MAEADSVGLLKIYNPLQWIPPTIVRYMQPPNWVPWLCFVENRPVVALNWGETVAIPLPAGRYEVCVGKWMLPVTEKFPERKLDFTQTVQVDIRSGQTVTLVFKYKRLQIAWLILAVVGLSWVAWNPSPGLDTILVWLPGYRIHSPAFLSYMVRIVFMYVCSLPGFYWFISCRFKKRGFMTVLEVVKPERIPPSR